MKCAGISSSCNGEDVRQVKLFMRATLRPLCAGCRAALDAAGADYKLADPEPPKPLWLRVAGARERGLARDESGRIVA